MKPSSPEAFPAESVAARFPIVGAFANSFADAGASVG